MSAKIDPVNSTSEAEVASQCPALGTADGKSEDTQAEDHSPEDCKDKKRLDELVAQVEALAVPGYTVREEGVFTVIRRTRRVGRNNTYLCNILR